MSAHKHPQDMTREELLNLVFQFSLTALDLAQHLSFSEDLKPEYKDNAYKRATEMAYKLVYLWENEQNSDSKFNILFFGKNGLERK